MLSKLPIDSVLPALLAEIRAGRNAVLRAPTGAGKTTRVPRALFDEKLSGGKQILLLEPRRLAARAAARRIAVEMNCNVGEEVGYHVRFDRRAGARTKILVITEGIFVRFMQEDPFLERAGIVLFDEFHERNLDADLGFAMARKLQIEARPDLRMIAMSATLDAAPLATFLGNCNIIESAGRLHPVADCYIPRRGDEPLEKSAAAAVDRALLETDGHILVFLPGAAEIRRAREILTKKPNILLLDLHGEMPPEAQDEVLKPSEVRKVILATNVAETSLTIEGVTAVVDSGLRKVLIYDPAVGLDRLEIVKISQSSARQRAGRAGRTSPGICYHLWNEMENRSFAINDEPEIARVDLAGAMLQLRSWGESDLRTFPWFEKPPEVSLARAELLLSRLGAVDASGMTQIGKAMAAIPAHPRIARLLIEGYEYGIPEHAALAAALLSERDPFRYHLTKAPPGSRGAAHTSPSDLLDRVHILQDFEKRGSVYSDIGEIQRGAAKLIFSARDQYLQILEGRVRTLSPPNFSSADEALLHAIFVAYADRLARRRTSNDKKANDKNKERRGVMAGGRGVQLSESSAVTEAEFFVCINIDAGGAESIVRIASAVEPEWLPQDWIQTKEEAVFDENSERVVVTRKQTIDGITIRETAVHSSDSEKITQILAAAARRDVARILPKDGAELGSFLARAACLRAWLPELQFPDVTIEEIINDVCAGKTSFEALQKAPWLDFLKSRLTRDQILTLDREAPETIQVPSGSFIKIQYEPGKPPVLAARIQELFGMRETPKIARGRVSLLLHLLAPNYRPQQITNDLASFWNHTYPKVRKELRARYPRHAWPEDPWTAAAERKPRPRNH
ncbi:MAG: ATP-dependent helicase HrpB [Planctomycetota bacterium]